MIKILYFLFCLLGKLFNFLIYFLIAIIVAISLSFTLTWIASISENNPVSILETKMYTILFTVFFFFTLCIFVYANFKKKN